MNRRRLRQFVPALGFDNLERRLCLDATGTDPSAAEQAMFDQIDAGDNLAPQTASISTQAMMSWQDKQEIIDIIEAQRKDFNAACDATIKYAQDSRAWAKGEQAALASYSQSYINQGIWQPNWWKQPTGNPLQNLYIQKWAALQSIVTMANEMEQEYTNNKVIGNQLIDDIEASIEFHTADSGEQDVDGNEVYYTWYELDDTVNYVA